MRASEIRSIIKGLGGNEIGRALFVDRYLTPMLEGKKLANGREIKKNPEDFSFRALFEGMVGEIRGMSLQNTVCEMRGRRLPLIEAIGSTSFTTATSNIIQQAVIQGYHIDGLIGDQLVTRMPSTLKSERISGFTEAMSPKTVNEGMPYEEASFTDKYVTTETAKKGRIISLTEEAIVHDQTGQMVMRARRIGETTAQERELTILTGVTGEDANVYKPSGTAETLYHSTNNNLLTSTALADFSSIDAVLEYHAANVTDDRQGGDPQPILWNPNIILVNTKKRSVARRIVNATEIRQTSNTNNLTVSANPNNNYTVLSSSLVPGTNTNWYLGDFKRQFIWQEIFPLETFAQTANSESAFERDVISRFKVRYYGGIAAIDERYVVKCTE